MVELAEAMGDDHLTVKRIFSFLRLGPSRLSNYRKWTLWNDMVYREFYKFFCVVENHLGLPVSHDHVEDIVDCDRERTVFFVNKFWAADSRGLI